MGKGGQCWGFCKLILQSINNPAEVTLTCRLNRPVAVIYGSSPEKASNFCLSLYSTLHKYTCLQLFSLKKPELISPPVSVPDKKKTTDEYYEDDYIPDIPNPTVKHRRRTLNVEVKTVSFQRWDADISGVSFETPMEPQFFLFHTSIIEIQISRSGFGFTTPPPES